MTMRSKTGGASGGDIATWLRGVHEDDIAPLSWLLWWEEFRLPIAPVNVGRLYTGSSPPSDSSFLLCNSKS